MTKHTETLQDKVILVTGAGAGIGAAVAQAYGHMGATVILLDKNIAGLEQSYDGILMASDATPAIYPLDLKGATADDYQQLISTIEQHFGRLDGLVHCAASLGQLAPVELQNPKVWLETLHINLTGPYLLTRSCLSLLNKQQRAAIIFTSDAYKNKAYWSAYGISKAAIETLCHQLADEFENEGKIHVHCVEPGPVNTALYRQAFPANDPRNLAEPSDVVDAYIQPIRALSRQ